MRDPNLYAQIDPAGNVRQIVMPDSLGVLTAPAPTGEHWYAVTWPVNPHFTGKSMIAEMIADRFPHRKPAA